MQEFAGSKRPGDLRGLMGFMYIYLQSIGRNFDLLQVRTVLKGLDGCELRMGR
jgi:hypothetical protein